MEHKGKIALITGGGRGLGRDMALRIAEKGIDVIITYISREEDARNVVKLVQEKGRKAAALQLNAGEVKGFGGFFTQLKTVLKDVFNTDRFDFLVNNAGIGRNAPVAEVTEQVFDELLNVHFKGVYFLTQEALALINDGGGIINVSSGHTRVTMARYSAYGSMKAAVEAFTRYLAVELGPRGIRSNVIAPGAIATDFSGGIVRDNADVNKMVRDMTALGRAGLPEDIGGVVAFLCTEDARWITAQRIEVSGGMRI